VSPQFSQFNLTAKQVLTGFWTLTANDQKLIDAHKYG
jgi:hypothetical protein